VAQSRGAGFVLDPGHPNALAPGKQPAHTLMPVMAHRGDRLAAISATMGGSAHPQISTMSLLRAFDLGMAVEDVVSAPRWLADGMDPLGPDPFVLAEPAAARVVGGSLREAGFRVDELPGLSEEVGHAQLLVGAMEVSTRRPTPEPMAGPRRGSDYHPRVTRPPRSSR
jgi:gamma-glutamyltranspeptidase/glutathione hydrolase